MNYPHQFPDPSLAQECEEGFARAVSGDASFKEALEAACIPIIGDAEAHGRVLAQRPHIAERISVLKSFRSHRTSQWLKSGGI